MAMSMDDSARNVSSINVTPMIDNLLALWIIFMAIAPAAPKGLAALRPQTPGNKNTVQSAGAIVIQLSNRPGGVVSYKINQADVSHTGLLSKLTGIYANRAERLMFVKGDDDVNFASIADVIDMGRAANVNHTGLMTPKIQIGQ
jgi:biopolymer transport protein TolR